MSPSSPLQKRCVDGGWHRWAGGRECVKCYLTKGRESRRNATAQARRDALLELRGVVEGLLQEAGGLCAAPDDFDPDCINICATHSEIMFGDPSTCDDDPHQYRAVLSAIDHLVAESTGSAIPEGLGRGR